MDAISRLPAMPPPLRIGERQQGRGDGRFEEALAREDERENPPQPEPSTEPAVRTELQSQPEKCRKDGAGTHIDVLA